MLTISRSLMLASHGSSLKFLHCTVQRFSLAIEEFKNQERADHSHQYKSLVQHVELEIVFSKSAEYEMGQENVSRITESDNSTRGRPMDYDSRSL